MDIWRSRPWPIFLVLPAIFPPPVLARFQEPKKSNEDGIGIKDLQELENAQAEYNREERALKQDQESKLGAITEQFLNLASRGKNDASKKGDLQLALAWDKFKRELDQDSVEESDQESDEDIPRSVQKAWDAFDRELKELRRKHSHKLRGIREKHRKAAEEGKKDATRKGKLELAQAWEEFERRLEPQLENLALNATVTASAQLRAYRKELMQDGNSIPLRGWYAGRKAPKPHWALFRLDGPKVIHKVRLLAPVGTEWNPTGWEPLNYDVLIREGTRIKFKVSVRGGDHLQRELSENGKTQWIEIDLKKAVQASQVEFHCYKTSGRDRPPYIFEFEILGEE